MPTENRSSKTELSKIITESLVGMVTGVTGMKPPADEPLPGFIQAPIDRAVTRISGLLAQTAQQHQGEPVAVLYANGTVLTKADCGDVFDICCKVETPLYTHADPAEVERLRAELAESDKCVVRALNERDAGIEEWSGIAVQNGMECDRLRQKLTDAQALLRDLEGKTILSWPDKHRISAALSASAEPSTPQSKSEKLSRCTNCDNCQGFNTGHDSSHQKPYSIRCDNCHKEARAADHAGLTKAWNAINQAR